MVHLAANADVRFGWESPRRDLEQNVVATHNVLEAMRAARRAPAAVLVDRLRLRRDAPSCRRRRTRRSRSRRRSTARRRPPPRATSPRTPRPGTSRAPCSASCRSSARATRTATSSTSCASCCADPTTLAHPGRRRRSARATSTCHDCVAAVTSPARGHEPQFEVFNLGVDDYCTVTDSVGWICERLGRRPDVRVHRRRPRLDRRQPVHLPRHRAHPRAAGWTPRFAHPGGGGEHGRLPARATAGSSTRPVTDGRHRYRDSTVLRSPRMTLLPQLPRRRASRRSPRLDAADIEAVVEVIRATRRAWRPAVLLRLGRRRRPRLARGVRLPQARGLRGVLRHRQRVRADRPRSTTTAGTVLRRLAARVAHRAPRDCLFVFSVGGGASNAGQRQPRAAPCELAQEVGASSVVGVAGRDGGELRTCADASVLHPDRRRRARHAADRGPAGTGVAPDRLPPRAGPATAKWESITERPVDAIS